MTGKGVFVLILAVIWSRVSAAPKPHIIMVLQDDLGEFGGV